MRSTKSAILCALSDDDVLLGVRLEKSPMLEMEDLRTPCALSDDDVLLGALREKSIMLAREALRDDL
jgi:hypothetical protein